MKFLFKILTSKVTLYSIIGIIIISVIALLYSTLIEPNILVINNISLPAKKLNNDVKIVIVSDLHAPISKSLFQKIIKNIKKFNPDLILIPGDMNAHLIPKHPSIEIINKLANLTGKKIILIMGDSDICSLSGQCIYCQSKYNKDGIAINATILRDSIATPLPNVSIAGIDFSYDDNWKVLNLYDSIPDSNFKLLLIHNTAGVKRDYFANYDLSISGNTHGGQVVLSAHLLSKFDHELDGRFIKGLYYNDRKPLLVSSGIGTSFLPIRFGVPPEIITLTLKGKKND